MTTRFAALSFACLSALPLSAQNDQKAADEAAQRVRNGGTFFEPKWRRGKDGMLEIDLAGGDSPDDVGFEPLLGKNMECGYFDLSVKGRGASACWRCSVTATATCCR